MGFLDKILKTGMRAANNAINKAVNDTVYDTVHSAVNKTLRGGIDNAKEAVSKASAPVKSAVTKSSSTVAKYDYDDREFDEKLPEVLKNIGDFEIRKDISPDEIEQEAGMKLYKRGGCYRLPKNISYAIYKNGQRVLFINTWGYYEAYKHVANRNIKDYCDKNSTPMLDFFEYLPNDVKYMEERIRKALA